MVIGLDGFMNKSNKEKKLEILFSDNHLLAVNKRSGLLTQDSGTGKVNLEDIAREFVKIQNRKKGNVFLHACHRIDREVSGIVLFARTSKALRRLTSKDYREKMVKIYHAIVEGNITKKSDELVDYLLHQNYKSVISTPDNIKAKKAILNYKFLKKKSEGTKLEINLLTGRYHQIRVQLSNMGNPILGDTKYGAKRECNEIALHHYKLLFCHPVQKKIITINAPYPKNEYWF